MQSQAEQLIILYFTEISMKVVALKDLNLGGTGIAPVTIKKGDTFIISDTQPDGGNIVFYNELGTGKKLPLVLGTDIDIIEDVGNLESRINTKKQYGSLMFVGGGLLLLYLVYKIVKS